MLERLRVYAKVRRGKVFTVLRVVSPRVAAWRPWNRSCPA
ncbi:hypothetical protein AKJ09_00608 [Labilithrix luteola]|uniref:Uncharacterized protein n=1 Tax=Labilithrix luteola TaxID=1391654 RepID=A0A0K1PLE9_9BACT|nr:hypothetical protein AKJ09_00608 [Labilithrix luteola]